MNKARPTAVAGTFYAADPVILASDIGRMLDQADVPSRSDPPPKAVIAPHAGYVYSGPIAAQAYATLAPAAGRVRTAVVVGPAHYVAVNGIAAPKASVFQTPLGPMPVDRAAINVIAPLPQVMVSDRPHRPEHSVEVHLPFLRQVLGEIAIVPLVVGDASAEETAEVLERLWDGDETVIVISSDLSHYQNYQTARTIDAATATAIEALQSAGLTGERACGYKAIQGLLLVARRRGLAIERLDLRNSGDTAGDKSAVVGYGAWAFWE